MKKRLIAIDLDDVVADFCPAFCDFAGEKWGNVVTRETYTEDWGVLFGADADEWQRRVDELMGHAEFYLNLRAVPGAREALEKIRKKFDVVAVTSRCKIAKDATEAWVERYLPGLVDEVFFPELYKNLDAYSHKKTKGSFCKELGACCLIDDQPKHCVGVMEEGMKAVLFGDYGWNRDEKVSGDIMRAKNWDEVLALELFI